MALPMHEAYRRDIAEQGFEIPDPLLDYLNRIGEEKFLDRGQEIRLSRQAKLERAEDDAACLRAARGSGTRLARPGRVSGRHRDGLASGLFHVVVGAVFVHLGFFQRATMVVRG